MNEKINAKLYIFVKELGRSGMLRSVLNDMFYIYNYIKIIYLLNLNF